MSERLPPDDPDLATWDAWLALPTAQSVPLLQAAVQRQRAEQRRFHLAYALATLARCLAVAGEMPRDRDAAQEALQLFRELQSSDGQALALNALGVAAIHRGDYSEALDSLNRAAMLARGTQWPELAGRIANTLGVTLNDMGHPAHAVQVLEEGLASIDPAVSARLAQRLSNNLSSALVRCSQLEREQGLAEASWRPRALQAVALARDNVAACRKSQPADLGHALDNLASGLVLIDETTEAHAVLAEAEQEFKATGNDYGLIFVAATSARAWLQQGRPLQAVGAVEAGLAAAAHGRVSSQLDELYRLLSLAHEARGEFQQALAAHRQFHELRSRFVLDRAEAQARALAVTLDTERALRESRQDALTGLANRRAFDERLQRLLPRVGAGQGLALAVIDIDHFKQVNDQHGHLVGDEALRQVARLLRAHCREQDLAARLGGDEFGLLLSGPRGAAMALCERIRRLLVTEGMALPAAPQLSLSIGIAETDQPLDPATLMRRADAALYAVKAAGRDGVGLG